MAETALTEYQPSRSRMRDRLLALLADPNITSIQEAGRKAGYSDSSVKSYVYTILKDPKCAGELERKRSNRLDKARGLAKRGAAALDRSLDAVKESKDAVLLAEVGTRAMKLGLDYQERVGQTGEVDEVERHKQLRVATLRLAYHVVRASRQWGADRVLEWLERARREVYGG